MIKKSLLTAALLLVIYHLLFPHLSRKFYQINGQQRENYLRAQHYIYDCPAGTNIILGSSMSLELNQDMLGPSYYKLTFPGGNTLTALEIIRRSEKRPPLVLIETNNIAPNPDEQFLHDLFSPWLFQLRRYSPVFKEEGRPANFVVGIVEACVRRTDQLRSGRGRSRTDNSAVSQTAGVDQELFAKLLRGNHEVLVHPLSPARLSEGVTKLGEYVDELTRTGTTCVFFEMPIDSSLMNLPQPAGVREAVTTRFPKDKYRWFEFANDHDYNTVDGMHLTRTEADKVTQSLMGKIAQAFPKQAAAALAATNDNGHQASTRPR
ncbi:MAG TPA: hypothetical protein VGM62_10310 [Chthoniobacterales bacterium]|jgi:hypothetical protein